MTDNTDSSNLYKPLDPVEAAWRRSPEAMTLAEFKARLALEAGWGNSEDAWR
ncbi:hypothetical protein SAMN02800687_2752 [Curtobacterium sp. UNCCL20]|uniref:hypothetical protein n=1 Tax=Curtobacterium sp. UNCCL20 TaxID=1502773 RepID=UPI000885B5AF|nr:hypothetical protein [Curtobacterium sp. UNCCL20]SDQ83077.1 hypothetical protein SAMN02800687_2752 [Curtobacterium sp. UNCCL20]